MKESLYVQRRKWVNKEFGDATRGTHMSKQNKTKLLRKLWDTVKRDIK